MSRQWNRAGRPSTHSQVGKRKAKPMQWTKEELSIITATESSASVMLAIAVVKQWIRDGKPVCDMQGIKRWIAIIQDSLNEKNDATTYGTEQFGSISISLRSKQ